MNFYTADLHVGHANIIRYCQRPFASVDAMNEALVSAWRRKIGPEDTVYVVGDFSLVRSSRMGEVQALFDALQGRKILIRGNHDAPTVQGWAEIHDILTLQDNGREITLCHYPLREWPGMWKGGIHLYGHVHGNMAPLPGSMDVGVDVWGGEPVTLAEILPWVEPFTAPAGKAGFRAREWPDARVVAGSQGCNAG